MSITAYHWLHEDELLSSNGAVQVTPPPITRSDFMLKLRQTLQVNLKHVTYHIIL